MSRDSVAPRRIPAAARRKRRRPGEGGGFSGHKGGFSGHTYRRAAQRPQTRLAEAPTKGPDLVPTKCPRWRRSGPGSRDIPLGGFSGHTVLVYEGGHQMQVLGEI